MFGLQNAILVPYPHAAENHQETNADIYVDAGAAEKFLESGTSAETLARRITELLADDNARDHMSAAARAIVPADAAATVADVIEQTVRKTS